MVGSGRRLTERDIYMLALQTTSTRNFGLQRRLPGNSAFRAAGILLALAAVSFGQVTINEFTIPTANANSFGIAGGPDGNL